jgi:alkylhydroperoxidase/carboxymuconolactone decarboxylase family protein YurZ
MSSDTSDTPVLDLLAKLTADSLQVSTLDPKTFMLVRIAALMAVNAPPASYLLNLGAAGQADVTAEQIRDVALAVAPIVGTPRIVATAGNILRAYGFAIEAGMLAEAEATS